MIHGELMHVAHLTAYGEAASLEGAYMSAVIHADEQVENALIPREARGMSISRDEWSSQECGDFAQGTKYYTVEMKVTIKYYLAKR